MEEAGKLREEGNQHFKAGNLEEALACYTRALQLGSIKDSEKAVILKNRAACFLKREDFEAVVQDASESLELVPEDPKALWRRCQALEKLGRLEEAFRDATLLLRVEPGNKSMQAVFNRLNPLVQQRIKEQNTTSAKLQQMYNLAFDKSVELEKRKPAVNNLIVLTREDVAAAMVSREGGLARVAELLAEKELDLVLGAVRIFTNIAKDNKQRSTEVLTVISLPRLLQLLNSENETLSTTTALLLQNLFNDITGVQVFQEAVKKYHEVRKKGEPSLFPKLELDQTATEFADNLFQALIKMIDNAKTHGHARDSAMELLARNITFKDGINWIPKFMQTRGIESLLTVAGTVAQHKTLSITENSRMHASVALSRIYDDLNGDKLREQFRERCITFVKELFGDDIYESKIEAVEALSTLLQGPFEVGNSIMETEGVPELMFTMAQSENLLHQRVAVEAIVNSAAKKSRCSGLLKDAVPILKNLYKSSDDHIKVRALVGMCKLGSFGGTDASVRPMAEGSNLALAKCCRKLLIRPDMDVDVRKWATEGLAYLTLDADIKEELINDPPALKSIFDLASKADRNTTYASLTVLVNLTNSYDVQEIMPELKDLAQYSKVHIPEDHPKDKEAFIVGRVRRLVELGVINALVALSGSESENSRELLSRVFLAIATVTNPDLRGHLVQQGAVKVLISLSQEENTERGKTVASQALAKIAVTMNPTVAFPGQRIYELVRPLLHLLHVDMSGLQNFEALLALTNLASVSDSVRNRIHTEKGLSKIEHYMYEEHEQLRCAATECICNLVMHDKMAEMFEGENDRVKLLVLFCGEPDPKLASAAAGALAILSARPQVCQKIVKVSAWKEILLYLTANENAGLQHRGCHIVLSMMMADKELAATVVESQIFEVLMAVTMYSEPERQAAQKCAQEALEVAKNLGLIQPFGEGQQADQVAQLHRIQELMRVKEQERLAALKEEEELQKEEEELQKKREEATLRQEALEEERDREFMYEFPEEFNAYEEAEEEEPKIKEVSEEEAARITATKESKPKDSKNGATLEASKTEPAADVEKSGDATSAAKKEERKKEKKKKEEKKERKEENGEEEKWDGYSTPPDEEEEEED